MTHNLLKIKSPPRKAQLVAGGVFIVAALVSMIVWNNARTGNAFLTYSNADIKDLTATIKTTQGTQNLSRTGGHFSLPEDLQKTLSAPYRLSFSVPSKNGEQQDFVLNLSQDGKQLTVSLDGFSVDNTVSLALGGDIDFKDVPMDWSGRNELITAIDDDIAVKVCIEVSGKAPAHVCHVIPQRGKA